MKSVNPPKNLYFGATTRNLSEILEKGLKGAKSKPLVLNQEKEPCIREAKKKGKPSILAINSKQMNEDGHKFYIQKGGTWIVDSVPSKYISKAK